MGIFLVLAAAASLSAAGAQDAVLIQADELIDQKKYDEAVRILGDYIKENPDKFGDAQKRLQRIVKIREQFNLVANELLDVLVDDPGNSDKILELSNRLVVFGSASDSSTQDFLDQAREVAAFTVNRRRLEQILAAGRDLLEQGNYPGAIRTYAGGMDIYQADFFASGYGADADKTARDGLQTVNDCVNGFGSLALPFNRAASVIVSLPGNVGPDAVQQNYLPLVPLMEQMSALRTGLVNTETEYNSLLSQLQQINPNLADRSFLSFANRLISGPADVNEGMIGTLDRFWDSNITGAEAAAAVYAANNYADALQALNSGLYEDALPLINIAQQYLAISKEFIDSWNSYMESSEAVSVSIFGNPVTEQKAPDFLDYSSMGRALDFFKISSDIGVKEKALEFSALDSWREGSMEINAAISAEQNSRLAFYAAELDSASLMESVNSEILTWENSRSQYTPYFNADKDPFSYLYQARTIAANLAAHIKDQETQAFVRQYTISSEDLENRVTAREQEFADANSQISGIVRHVDNAEGEQGTTQVVSYYPSEGLDILTKMNQSITDDLDSGQQILASLGNETDSDRNSAEGRSINTAATSLINRLKSLQTRSAPIAAAARTQINQAAAFRMEGDRLYQEAQTALTANNFDLARERLSLCQDRYSASLAIQESDTLRQLRDTRLISLGADIVRLENEYVVREVRDRVTKARDAYYQGNFDEAETQLVTALNRWRTTNSTEEPEINYWLTMTRNAISLSSGREIPVTAPLYAEMSQLLSEAKINYDEGVRLINAGQRTQGLSFFDYARSLTQKIELMFPLNRESRLLDLRIEQFTNPTTFNASFQQRLSAAVAGTKPNVRSVESFADLQNLAEINPNYPGISQILTQAEIDMGYRPPPPDPQALARSDNLTRQARPIVENRSSTLYDTALDWLNEAISLNPNNSAAAALKDTLLIQSTGTGTIVMDSKSYDDYQRAVMEFQRGNKYTAWAIVQDLMRNPNNQKQAQILELQRRIEASL
ncbi:MAG: hypothetical protein FWD78_15805 [Treponema sp.]|nr:hypothetical protein [Treponema sp.]